MVNAILRQTNMDNGDTEFGAFSCWLNKTGFEKAPENSHKQSVWDKTLVENTLKGKLDVASQARLCGAEVDESGRHGLHCKISSGRIARHTEINNFISVAIYSLNAPNVLEPNHLCRSDGKRSDGMTIFPWKENVSSGTRHVSIHCRLPTKVMLRP
ncbi:hypothetical protein ACOME3_000516 [Neoechinorhynchus agilis]